jgi:hypothetical protein
MIRRESNEVVNLDDPKMWLRVCSQRAKLFRRVMPTAFENLAIAQHKDTLWYATIRGGGYWPSICRFHVGDYVYLQQTAPTMLDVMVGRTIWRMREVLASGVLMLEGAMVLFRRTMCVIVHHVTSQMWMLSLAMIWANLKCMLCESKGGTTYMLVCDRCSRGWHMACMTPPMDVVPIG